MVTAGVDVGFETTKVVILNEDKVLSQTVAWGRNDQAGSVTQKALERSAHEAHISLQEIMRTVFTGRGREFIPHDFENMTLDKISESFCCAKGIYMEQPSVRTVVDIGAERTMVVACDKGKVVRTTSNDRCAAGSGRYLRMVADLLWMDVEEMGSRALAADKDLVVENTCAVFAESEIISLIHLKEKPENIVKGVFNGLALRIYPLLTTIKFEQDLALIGGVAKCSGMVKALEDRLRTSIIIPDGPEYIGAKGAAFIGQEKLRGT